MVYSSIVADAPGALWCSLSMAVTVSEDRDILFLKVSVYQSGAWALEILLHLNSASWTDWKRIQTPHKLCCDLGPILGGDKTFTFNHPASPPGETKHYNLLVRLQSSSLSPSLSLCRSSGNLCAVPSPEGTWRFRGQNLSCSACQCWGWSDWLAHWQTQGDSKSAAVAAGSNRLAWGQHATSLAILTQFKSQKVLMLCKFWAATSNFYFHVKWNVQWSWQEVVAYQSSSHWRFPPWFHQSLVSG